MAMKEMSSSKASLPRQTVISLRILLTASEMSSRRD